MFAAMKNPVMKPFGTQLAEAENWDYAMSVSIKDNLGTSSLLKVASLPSRCWSSPRAADVSKPPTPSWLPVVGDRMIITNATGCSSIWGGSAPSRRTAPTRKKNPAGQDSRIMLNTLCVFVGIKQMRDKLADLMKEAMARSPH